MASARGGWFGLIEVQPVAPLDFWQRQRGFSGSKVKPVAPLFGGTLQGVAGLWGNTVKRVAPVFGGQVQRVAGLVKRCVGWMACVWPPEIVILTLYVLH